MWSIQEQEEFNIPAICQKLQLFRNFRDSVVRAPESSQPTEVKPRFAPDKNGESNEPIGQQ